jgi:hypothetical protein
MEFQWTVPVLSTGRFELAQLPDELILKLGTVSSKVWTRLAFSIPFVGRWSLDTQTLKTIQRSASLPLIECLHLKWPNGGCRCYNDTCCWISEILARFLCVDQKSMVPRRLIDSIIADYITANGLIFYKDAIGYSCKSFRLNHALTPIFGDYTNLEYHIGDILEILDTRNHICRNL